jgi:uncharacterized protein YifN (PemK superfamily)
MALYFMGCAGGRHGFLNHWRGAHFPGTPLFDYIALDKTLTITFHPSAGCVLMCDFAGFVVPEMVKTRPIVIVSSNHLNRGDLHTVVPLSTTAPNPVEPYHYKLSKDPIPGSNTEVWAKCDMIVTIRTDRLDRFKVGRGAYKTSGISREDLAGIRHCLKYVLGISD